MRTLVPAETLVYLETNDLAAALQPIVDAKPFKEVAKSQPDFSALKGVQLAVAVTGFETSEEKLTDEHSLGRVQPRFVAVADTHAWNYQAVAFAEKKLGGFVTAIYDSEPRLEKSDKHGGKYFIWNAADGRNAFALVIDSLIYFGNDATAIEKCLAVKRGETDSIIKTGKIKPPDPTTLAAGYVSTDAIAQIANLAGLQFASQASDESEVQSAIAGILPQLIRNSVTDITWTSAKTEQGIEDRYQILVPSDIANVFSETFSTGEETQQIKSVVANLISNLPLDTPSATRYNLRNPQVAWRSVLLTAQKKTDPLAGKVLGEVSGLLFEPYGIRDPELFLNSVGDLKMGRNIVTAKLDIAGDELVVIATRGENDRQFLKALTSELKPPEPVVEGGQNLWVSKDADLGLLYDREGVGIGSLENLKACLFWTQHDPYEIRSERLRLLASSRDPIASVGQDTTTTLSLVAMLAREGHGETQAVSTYLTETRFTKSGMERKTTSDFGLIGQIIAQLAQD